MIRRAPTLVAALAFVIGLSLGRTGVPVLPGPALALAGLMLGLPFLGASRPAQPLAVGSVLAGFLLAGLGTPASLSEPSSVFRDALAAGRTVHLLGRVMRVPVERDGALRFEVAAEGLDGRRSFGELVLLRIPRGATTAGNTVAALLPGEHIQVPVQLRAPRGFGNPGSFDYAGHLRRRGILALAWVKSPLLVERFPRPAAGRASYLGRVQRALRTRLTAAMPDARARGIVLAMLLGDRSGVGQGDVESLVRAGTIHLLAVSGLHVGLLAWMMVRAAGGVGLRPIPARILVLLSLPLYVELTGSHAPVVRAAWMAGVLLSGTLAGRTVSPLSALGAAAIAALAPTPEALVDPSVQLSFGATGGILLLGGSSWARRRGPITSALVVSASAFLGVLPLLGSQFHRVSPIGMIASLPATPLVALTLAGALASVLLEMLMPGTGFLAGEIARWAARCVLGLSELLGGIPGGNWPSAGPEPGVVLCYYALFFTWGLSRGRGALVPVLRGLFLLAVAAVLAGSPGSQARQLQVHVIDVGQGDAILLRFPGGRDVLVDGGGLGLGTLDVGASVVSPALWALGVRRLERVVVTHSDRDHSGGIPAILERFPVDEIWIPPESRDEFPGLERVARRKAVAIREVSAGWGQRWGRGRLEVLHPRGRSHLPVNDHSLVLRLRYGEFCMLLMADTGSAVERILMSHPMEPCDVLKVGHHGSKTGTGAGFLMGLRPRFALISSGDSNPWGHPNNEVLRRLRSAGVYVLRTDRHGMVTLVSDGRGIRWSTYRGGGDGDAASRLRLSPVRAPDAVPPRPRGEVR